MSSVQENRSRIDLSMLVNSRFESNVIGEVRRIFSGIYGDYDFNVLFEVYSDVVRLYQGRYPGYKRCNTEYHNLQHTLEVFLATARFIHGRYLFGARFSREIVTLGLMSALLHDTGYIQTENDSVGTGAKFTTVHVSRSIDFTNDYFCKKGFSEDAAEICSRLIKATDIDDRLFNIPFENNEEKEIAKAIFAADLMAQMSDRVYLEKLLLLYREFEEAELPEFKHEFDLLSKTPDFYEFVKERLINEANYNSDQMKRHFAANWNISSDLYSEAISKNMGYLQKILVDCPGNYRDMLKRDGIVTSLGITN